MHRQYHKSNVRKNIKINRPDLILQKPSRSIRKHVFRGVHRPRDEGEHDELRGDAGPVRALPRASPEPVFHAAGDDADGPEPEEPLLLQPHFARVEDHRRLLRRALGERHVRGERAHQDPVHRRPEALRVQHPDLQVRACANRLRRSPVPRLLRSPRRVPRNAAKSNRVVQHTKLNDSDSLPRREHVQLHPRYRWLLSAPHRPER